MRILLTGATGFIGSYTLGSLLDAGHCVNILIRYPEKFIYPVKDRIQVYNGDVNDFDSVKRSIENCDVVIHLAALVKSSAKDPSLFYHTNLQGTANLLKAAEQGRIKKFIFTSSLSAHGFSNDEIICEHSLIKPKKYFNEYAESKARAEELVEDYGDHGLPYIIIYPTRMFGIGSLSDANASTKVISLYLKNRLPFVIDHGKQYASWAFVEDIARGIVSAAVSNISNERFLLGGENKTLAEVYDMADAVSGKKHLRFSINFKTSMVSASILEFLAGAFGRKPIVTKEWLKFILDSRKFSCEKAVVNLNYKITPFNRAMGKTIDWLLHRCG
jgi:nucleoside-diphosphate-sugar epimerase